MTSETLSAHQAPAGDLAVPQICCVIPTYESLELAARAITAALEQEGVANAVIVSDDSTSDRIRRFVEALQPLYPHLRYMAGARNGNPVANWNHGLRHAHGRYAVLVHQDEFFVDRRYLQKAVARLEETGAVAVVADSQVIGMARASRFGAARRWLRPERMLLWTLWLTNWLGSTACVVFRREGAPEFDEALVGTVDIDFYMRLLAGKGELERLSGTMVASLGLHESQITTRVNLHGLARDEIMRKKAARAFGFPGWKWQLIACYWGLRGG